MQDGKNSFSSTRAPRPKSGGDLRDLPKSCNMISLAGIPATGNKSFFPSEKAWLREANAVESRAIIADSAATNLSIHFSEARGASEQCKNQLFSTHTSFPLDILSFELRDPEKAPLLGRRTRGQSSLLLTFHS